MKAFLIILAFLGLSNLSQAQETTLSLMTVSDGNVEMQDIRFTDKTQLNKCIDSLEMPVTVKKKIKEDCKTNYTPGIPYYIVVEESEIIYDFVISDALYGEEPVPINDSVIDQK